MTAVRAASSAALAELPRFAGYRAVSVIGRGGFGTVFAAEPEAGGPADAGARPAVVAIKLAHEHPSDAGRRLIHEIQVLSDVGPPHVPAVLASGRIATGAPYAVMEYIDAPTLAERLVSGPLPPGEAIAITSGLLRALAAVHARGWVHLDLKPENVFVVAGGAKIVDFGLVSALRARPDTRVEVAPGTAEYMSPEQCERHEAIDPRADLYAVGVILHELVAGVPPFFGPAAVVRESHLSRRPPRLSVVAPGTPRALEEIVLRCLAKDPEDRFESAAAVEAALARVMDDVAPPDEAPRPSVSPRAPSARDERRTVGLLFFAAEAEVLAVAPRLTALGGQLAHASGGRYVAVYAAGDNPARSARNAAQELVRQGLTDRVRVDVGTVSVQQRPDGSKRFLSPVFTRKERFPSTVDPAGVSLTPAADEVLDAPPPDAVERRRALQLAETGLVPTGRGAPPIGREAILEALVESAARAVRERGPTLVRVIASAGYGKTHVFRALGERLRQEAAAEVIELSALEPTMGGADQTVRELLLRTLDLPAEAPTGGEDLLREVLGRLGVADAAPAVAIALGWMAMEAPGPALGSGLRTLEAAPGALRSALTAAAVAALRGRAAARPVLILLDDAHRADEPALAALEHAAMAEGCAPLWICAMARPVFDEEHPSWGERAGHREAYRLGPLDAASAAALCRRLLLPVENVPASAVELLLERTQGIPLLLVELTRGLRREGLVRRAPRGDSYYLATDELERLPDLPLVEWQARGELDALPAALEAHARLLALLGEEVSIPDTTGVLRRLEDDGGDAELPLDARVGIQQLVAAGLLVEESTSRIAFRHALVREAIAKEVPEGLRRRIHAAAAAHYFALETAPRGGASAPRSPGPGRERRLLQLAFHAAQAGLGSVAEGAYLALAEHLRARHAYVPAERHYSRALEQPGWADDPRRFSAYRGRGLMRYRIGRHHDALADFEAARAMARRTDDVEAEIEILLDEATALDWMNDYHSSEERVREAQALMPRVRSPLLEARLLLGVGRSLQRAHREEEAAQLLEDAAAAAAALGDEGYETWVIALLQVGFIYQGLGRLEDAGMVLDRAVSLSEEHGDDLHLGSAINNRLLLSFLLGDRENMIANFERGLSLAQKVGQTSLEWALELNIGELFYFRDDLDAAEPHVLRSVELERQRAGDAPRPLVPLLEARLRSYRGEEDAARAIVARIRAGQDRARALGHLDVLMAPAEEVLCDMIDLATRDASPAEWDALEERSARHSVSQERAEVIEARALAALRRGRVEEAITSLERALDMAAAISNAMIPRLRRRLSEAQRRL